jgi:hypothetical protein
MKKKDLRTLNQKAQDYQCDLLAFFDDFSLYYKVPKKYLDWSLRDCQQMVKFYALVYGGRYKVAWNMLQKRGFLRSKVSRDIVIELDRMYQ